MHQCRFIAESDFKAAFNPDLPVVFEQGDVTDELEEHAESLSGRSRHRDERQDQQYGQLGVGQSQPQLAQYHLYAQTATSTPAFHYQQVDPAPLTRVQLPVLTVAFTFLLSLCSMSGFGMNRNQVFGMNNSIFNGTG